MSEKEKLILTKLVKVASDQQKVLIRLAQLAEGHDAVIDYLNKGLISVVAANLGVPNVHSEITKLPGQAGGVGTRPDINNPTAAATYLARIYGVPEKQWQAFGAALHAQLTQQKPELATNFTYTFETNQEH
jgi:hypothetical protein